MSEASGSQSQTIPLSDFLSARDDLHFVWNDANRETSELWLRPVEAAALDPRKHKVFHHGHKEYLRPPAPFVQQGPELGDSGSTVVYKVTAPEGYSYRRPLALKVIVCKDNFRPPGPDSWVRRKALEEVKNMTNIRHPHIVAYVASFEDYCIQPSESRSRQGKGRRLSFVGTHPQHIKRHILGIAMYPPAQCNLHTFMNEVFHDPKEVDWMLAHLHTYFGCLSQAVAYLHNQGVRIRHKDIKPENVVIDDFGLPILTDFGLSKHFEAGQYSEGPTLKTLKYADPEAVHETSRDVSSDIFSLGCVFLEMATVLLGKPPLFAEEQLNFLDGRPSNQFKYSESLHNLDTYLALLSSTHLVARNCRQQESTAAVLQILPHIRRMMDEDQKKRPRAQELYPWFRHLYDVYEAPGPCPNCEAERATGKAIPLPPMSGSGNPRASQGSIGGSAHKRG
ncbi:non-specific serine/threonine protein kinase [Madurella fahalii]|uniref:Non-specific serine/threonine protein kinase n=1 Tax=Madurella fahalii TaxID=1157608 RepID=A0ABQ0GDI8_9PEZI